MRTFYDDFVAQTQYVKQPVIAAQIIFNKHTTNLLQNYTQQQYEYFCEYLKTINQEYNFVDEITCTIWHTEKSWSTYDENDCGSFGWLFCSYPDLPLNND